MSLYAVPLRFTFTGTKGTKPVPAWQFGQRKVHKDMACQGRWRNRESWPQPQWTPNHQCLTWCMMYNTWHVLRRQSLWEHESSRLLIVAVNKMTIPQSLETVAHLNRGHHSATWVSPVHDTVTLIQCIVFANLVQLLRAFWWCWSLHKPGKLA